MTISTGSTMPAGTLTRVGDDGPERVEAAEFFGGRKVVLFGVPGAFTPTCHRSHMPGFVDNADALRAKGVDEIAVIAVNDPHVMKAWREASEARGKVTFPADGSADYARALGLDLDASGFGMGTRSRRFSMLVEDGTVKELSVEDSPGQVGVSGADEMLAKL